jgi:hypothetical protein
MHTGNSLPPIPAVDALRQYRPNFAREKLQSPSGGVAVVKVSAATGSPASLRGQI